MLDVELNLRNSGIINAPKAIVCWLTARAADASSAARVTTQLLRAGRCATFCVRKGITALLLSVNAAIFNN
jgi:hypothetical protein